MSVLVTGATGNVGSVVVNQRGRPRIERRRT